MRLISIALLSLGLGLVNSAVAQHSDAWLILNGNQIALSPVDLDPIHPQPVPVLVDETTGRHLFPSTFPSGDLDTDDPGFQSQSGALTANAYVHYRAVGTLFFWDGNAWVNSVPNDEQIIVRDSFFPRTTTTIDPGGVTNAEGFVTQVSSGGSIHQHVDYFIASAGSGAIAPGAYMIDLQLYATTTLDVQGPIAHEASEPFRLVFNYQLSQSEFDAAISALTTPATNVPVPAIAQIFIAAFIAGIAHFSRCRQKSIRN